MAFLPLFIFLAFSIYGKSSLAEDFIFNATVALDGSGDFESINKAIWSAPDYGHDRFYIHIKAGSYYEYVQVPENRRMIALIGDGSGVTVITGNRCPNTGYGTNNSSTVAVHGNGFMAQYLTFENSAGPNNGQAVALSTTSDRSVYYKCTFLGYQDTLYADFGHQFYKECDIYGTVDFIFGNAAAVFQDCNLYARPNGIITFTAQSRSNFEQKTGFSMQNCNFATTPGMEKIAMRAYFGRPWGAYATTVVIQSNIADIVDPSGWLQWMVPLDNIVYWEYQNTGPGSSTSGRVGWNGHRIITNSSDLVGFTVAIFIDGDMWLPETKVPYRSWLA